MPKKLTAEELRCMECGQACPCDLYQGKEPHAHCPGGLDDWLLCESCEKKCLKIHRPVNKKTGTWKWINDCGNSKCGYCLALARLRGRLAHPSARKAKKKAMAAEKRRREKADIASSQKEFDGPHTCEGCKKEFYSREFIEDGARVICVTCKRKARKR